MIFFGGADDKAVFVLKGADADTLGGSCAEEPVAVFGVVYFLAGDRQYDGFFFVVEGILFGSQPVSCYGVQHS